VSAKMLFRVQTTVNELGTLAATAVVRCTFTQNISDNENVDSVTVNSVDKAFN